MALKVTNPAPRLKKRYLRMLVVLIAALLVFSTIMSVVDDRLRGVLGPIARASVSYLIGAAVGLYVIRFLGGGR